jgi:hypothetical protein
MARATRESTGWRPGPADGPGLLAALRRSEAALCPGQSPVPTQGPGRAGPDRTGPGVFLWQLHHAGDLAKGPGPGRLEAALGMAAGAAGEGLLGRVGLCNAPRETVRRALAAVGITLHDKFILCMIYMYIYNVYEYRRVGLSNTPNGAVRRALDALDITVYDVFVLCNTSYI